MATRNTDDTDRASAVLHEPLGSSADLAVSVPESLTINIDLPAIVATTPDDEAHVAIDDVAITPIFSTGLTTTSIDVVADPVLVASQDEAVDEVAPEVPPLPDHDAGPTRRERQRGDTPRAAESASMLTAERLLDPSRNRKIAPEGFWQKGVFTATFHQVNLGDSAKVRERKAVDARISKRLEGGTRFVPILTRKGGVGKTTISTLLGMALADVRDDRVIAIDANPDRGTLSERVNKQTRSTVRDLVTHAPSIRDFTELSAHVSRDVTRLDVLASDTDPLLSEAFDENDYNVVADVAARYYSLVLTDCGTGIVHSVMRATLQRADSVVIVSGGSVDEARLASETLTWLEANNYGHLVKNAIVALNTATQGTNLVKLNEIEAHFRSRVRAIVRIPYDAELAAGSVVRYAALKPFTRASARELAALVMDGLPTRRDA
ncbi:MinD/ParA family protein [Lysinimonas soli]|uniref:MinD/ParA family protein n=1 Tax=Lysinimonas soli TaxID=1074233 RepID=A0ABW0NPB1_9MICO